MSSISGKLSQAAAIQMSQRRPEGIKEGMDFYACGISLVIHSVNPYVPTTHMNYRYFECYDVKESQGKIAWFGGGCDLTPAYLFEDDVRHFHGTYKDVCEKYSPSMYPKFKKWCDEYFLIKHRGECRGVGGIFFDDLGEIEGHSGGLEKVFEFVQNCGRSFTQSYLPLVKKRMNTPFGEREREWMEVRRGRYVEFNLVYDRGTKFGLYTPGSRIESILMSLPQIARWEYCHEVPEGSEEWKLLQVCKTPKDWF